MVCGGVVCGMVVWGVSILIVLCWFLYVFVGVK